MQKGGSAVGLFRKKPDDDYKQVLKKLDGRQVKYAEKGLYILRSVNEKGGVEVRKVLK